jgi:hypothetical protein
MLKSTWTAGAPNHPQEHNTMARVLNYRLYSSQYANLQAAIDDAIATGIPLELEPGATYAIDAPLRIENAEPTDTQELQLAQLLGV